MNGWGAPREGVGKAIYQHDGKWRVHAWSHGQQMFTVSGSFEIGDAAANSWLRVWRQTERRAA